MAYCSGITDATAYAAARIGIGLDGRSSLPASAADAIWGGQAARVAGALGAAGVSFASRASVARSWAADVERRLTSGHCLLAVTAGLSEADHSYGRSLVTGAEADIAAARTAPMYGWLLAHGAEEADQSASGWVTSAWDTDRDPSLDVDPGSGRPYMPPPAQVEQGPR